MAEPSGVSGLTDQAAFDRDCERFIEGLAEKYPTLGTEPRRKRAKVDRWVYAIECMETGLVKLGQSVDVDERLRALQAMAPTQLRLLCVAREQGKLTERSLHRRFRAERHHGEWFKLDPAMVEAMFAKEGLRT